MPLYIANRDIPTQVGYLDMLCLSLKDFLVSNLEYNKPQPHKIGNVNFYHILSLLPSPGHKFFLKLTTDNIKGHNSAVIS